MSLPLSEELREVADSEAVGVLMQQVLDRVVEVFEDAGVDVPSRQYLNVGQTQHECEQLTVSFRQLYLGAAGSPANEPQNCNSPRTVVLQVEVVRKVALPAARGAVGPDPDAMTALTHQKTSDAWLMLHAAASASSDYLGVIADIAITNPQGEYQATILNMTIGVP